MSCGAGGKNRYVYTGNQVGPYNHTGLYNFVAGSGLSTGVVQGVFVPNTLNRRLWERSNARFNDQLLDATYPVINLQWFAEITLASGTIFRVSDRSFYVQDADGLPRYYDARADKAPMINVTVGEWLTPNYEVSDLTLSLNNRDGHYNAYLPHGDLYTHWAGAAVVVKIGFGELHDNYFTLFDGQVTIKQGLEASRDEIEIRAYDKLNLDEIPIPPNNFSTDTYPDINSESGGQAVPLVYGDWTENVPAWGAVTATCVNAMEADPDEWLFKISDLALASINSVWLHRGDRNAGKIDGPISITESAMTQDLDGGGFSINPGEPVLDEPYVLIDNAKAAAGSGFNLITSNSELDFLSRGVKVGDIVTITTEHASSMIKGNLKFVSKVSGVAGNDISVEQVYLAIQAHDAVEVYGTATDQHHPLITVTADKITIGIPRQYDDATNTTYTIGAHKASHIKTAIAAHTTANGMVRAEYTGTVPIGYPAGTKTSGVLQDNYAEDNLASGQNDLLPCEVTAVTNYQLTVTGDVTFNENDEYVVYTSQYSFVDGDTFSAVCAGKPLNLISTTRIQDASELITDPRGLAVASNSTYWVADNETDKVYNISFHGEIILEIGYASIGLTEVNSIAIANDNKLWLVDDDTVYRYDYVEESLMSSYLIADIVDLPSPFTRCTGIGYTSTNKVWLLDGPSRLVIEVDPFAATQPFVVSDRTLDSTLTEAWGISVDETTSDLVTSDRTALTLNRIDPADGTIISSIDLTGINANITFPAGCCVGQDTSLFLLDQSTLSVYNYNDASYANYSPAFIARDLLQKFGLHTYNEFDLSWNLTAAQLSSFKCRAAISEKTDVVKYINGLMRQFNTAFHLRFGKFALFFITFDNFQTDGRLVKEKDIKESTFKPKKESNQYFNSASTSYDLRPFTGKKLLSDTYVSPAGVSFNGAEVTRKLDMPNLYRRADLDQMVPLFVRLAVTDPEFVDVTFGFRVIRSQMQDFMTINFTDDPNPETGVIESGRRYADIPCMIRKLSYNLDAMTVGMKLWSLGNTTFPGYTPPGNTVGGSDDPVVLTNLGRQGFMGPVGTITASGTNTLTLADVDAQNAETRTAAIVGLAWTPGYKVDLVDGATKLVVQTLTIASVAGGVVTFEEDFESTVSNTTLSAAGFINGGHFLQYTTYPNLSEAQRVFYASFGGPTDNYPSSRTSELEEQRSGAHNFADGGLPYVLYPEGFVSY